MKKIRIALFMLAVLWSSISCDDSLGILASIESETALSSASLTGYIQHVFTIGDTVYCVNGNLYSRNWSNGWTSWSKRSLPGNFRTVRHAAGLSSVKKIIALFDDGDTREFANGGLQIFDITNSEWTAADVSSLEGEPYAVFSSCDSSFAYLLTKDTGNKYYYHLYEWTGSDFLWKYTSPGTDSMVSNSEQSDNYRPRAVTKASGSVFIITKNCIYKDGGVSHSIGGTKNSDDFGGIAITSDAGQHIYARDLANHIYYSLDGGSNWTVTGSYSSTAVGESASLQYVPAGTLCNQTQPLLLMVTDGSGYDELLIDADGKPYATAQNPGTTASNSSIPHVSGNKSYGQYNSAIGTKTINDIFCIKTLSSGTQYSIYVSLVDSANTCLWGYHADSAATYTDINYPIWDRE